MSTFAKFGEGTAVLALGGGGSVEPHAEEMVSDGTAVHSRMRPITI